MSESSSGYYGTRADMSPPPGFSRRIYRERWQRGELPGKKLPGRGGIVVSVADWDAWLRSQTPPEIESIEADVRARFRCAS